MVTACLTLVLLGAALGGPLTWWARRLGVRWGQMDRPGERKVHAKATPATGGVAIFWTMALPLAVILAAVWLLPEAAWEAMVPSTVAHLPGGRAVTGMGTAMLGCMAALHVMGLYDDRRPLGPTVKLAVQLGVGAVMAGFFDVRLLELLGGPVSVAITVLWFAAIINAFNFLDNMDGLSGGVAAICGAILMAAALLGGQWFIAGVLGLLIGALMGFLWFNFPPASIFMGDGGSLVVGFVLAFCSVRLTYVSNDAWWAAATPLVVLAIPLYDLVSVTALRLRQGRSPFVGDTQHFSHRLVSRGLSRRAAVGVIWACTAATGLGGVMLAHVALWQAAVVVGQTAAVLLVLALLEMKTRGGDK